MRSVVGIEATAHGRSNALASRPKRMGQAGWKRQEGLETEKEGSDPVHDERGNSSGGPHWGAGET